MNDRTLQTSSFFPLSFEVWLKLHNFWVIFVLLWLYTIIAKRHFQYSFPRYHYIHNHGIRNFHEYIMFTKQCNCSGHGYTKFISRYIKDIGFATSVHIRVQDILFWLLLQNSATDMLSISFMMLVSFLHRSFIASKAASKLDRTAPILRLTNLLL